MGEGGAGLGLHYVPGRGSVGGEGGRATASCFGRRRGGTGDGELLRPAARGDGRRRVASAV